MRNATSSFTEEDRKKVAAAVLESETRTSAEIVPAVASASGRYDRAEDIVGLIAGLGGMIVVWLVFQREDPAAGGWDGLPLAVGLPALVPVMIAGFLVGAIVATRVGWLRRLFTPRGQMIEETNAAAAQLFHDSRIHHTAAASGVLVYLSLFERRAVILADRAAFDALGQTRIDELCRISPAT